MWVLLLLLLFYFFHVESAGRNTVHLMLGKGTVR